MANITQPAGAPAAGHKPLSLGARIRQNFWGYIFVSPWVLLYLVFGLYPLLLSFYLTFYNYSFVRPEDMTFMGIGNWLRGISDPLFWKSVFNISYNQAVFIFLKNGLGLVTAVLLSQALFGSKIFRTIYFMPVITSVVVLMTIGTYLVSPQGPIQNIMISMGILDAPIFWKFTRWLPMPVIALINSWKWFGISTVILLAGILAIDPGLYEASSLDGANGWQQFRFLTLPSLRPQLFFLLVVDVINGLQMFTEVFTQYDVLGGPQNQALTPVLYVYAQAFSRSNIGYASTLGLLLAVLIAIITGLQFRYLQGDQQR